MLDTVNENHLIDWKLYDDEGKREGSIEIACQNPVKEDCATSEFSEAHPQSLQNVKSSFFLVLVCHFLWHLKTN